MSFFPIRDSSGTTQLVVAWKKKAVSDLSVLSDVPVESAVLVEGDVCLRPVKDRRAVSGT
jgi:aspartyl-tRNA synthetase